MLFHQTGRDFENDITKLHQIAEMSLGKDFSERMSKEEINIGNISANISTADTIRIDEKLINRINDNANKVLDDILGANFKKGYVSRVGLEKLTLGEIKKYRSIMK